MKVTQIFGQRVWCGDIYWKGDCGLGLEMLVAWSSESRQVLNILQSPNVQFF